MIMITFPSRECEVVTEHLQHLASWEGQVSRTNQFSIYKELKKEAKKRNVLNNTITTYIKISARQRKSTGSKTEHYNTITKRKKSDLLQSWRSLPFLLHWSQTTSSTEIAPTT